MSPKVVGSAIEVMYICENANGSTQVCEQPFM